MVRTFAPIRSRLYSTHIMCVRVCGTGRVCRGGNLGVGVVFPFRALAACHSCRECAVGVHACVQFVPAVQSDAADCQASLATALFRAHSLGCTLAHVSLFVGARP